MIREVAYRVMQDPHGWVEFDSYTDALEYYLTHIDDGELYQVEYTITPMGGIHAAIRSKSVGTQGTTYTRQSR